MPRYVVSQFDGDTYVVLDQLDQREICVCSNYAGSADASERALMIALLLNQAEAAELL